MGHLMKADRDLLCACQGEGGAVIESIDGSNVGYVMKNRHAV